MVAPALHADQPVVVIVNAAPTVVVMGDSVYVSNGRCIDCDSGMEMEHGIVESTTAAPQCLKWTSSSSSSGGGSSSSSSSSGGGGGSSSSGGGGGGSGSGRCSGNIFYY